jgi:hypothetical protein
MTVKNVSVTYDVLTRIYDMGQTKQKAGKKPTATVRFSSTHAYVVIFVRLNKYMILLLIFSPACVPTMESP